jgi:hypothetical protein
MTTCADVMKSLAEVERTIKEFEELLDEPELTPQQRWQVQAKLAAARARRPGLLQEPETLGCPPPLEVHAIERTQATQFFLINGKGSGAAPDNSVPRLALRPLNLRVYVAEKWTPFLPRVRRVTGRLRYSRLLPGPQAGSPAIEWSMPPATNDCVGPHHPEGTLPARRCHQANSSAPASVNLT